MPTFAMRLSSWMQKKATKRDVTFESGVFKDTIIRVTKEDDISTGDGRRVCLRAA